MKWSPREVLSTALLVATLCVPLLRCTSAGSGPAGAGNITSSLIPLTPIGSRAVVFPLPTVMWLIPFSPAGAAGVRVGDLIEELGGRRVQNVDEVFDAQESIASSTRFEMVVRREGQLRRISGQKIANDPFLGFDVYPLESAYVLRDFPGLPSDVHYLNDEGFVLAAYAGSLPGLRDIAMIRFAIENESAQTIEAPTGVGATGAKGETLHRLTPADVVNAAYPSLGQEHALNPPPPEPPPVYTISSDGNLYPVRNSWAALAKLVTAAGNVAIAIQNQRVRDRQQKRYQLWVSLNEQDLRTAVLPPNSRSSGQVFYRVPIGERPFKTVIRLGSKWYSFSFQ